MQAVCSFYHQPTGSLAIGHQRKPEAGSFIDAIVSPIPDLLEKLAEEVEENQNRDAGEAGGLKSLYPLLLDQDRESQGKGKRVVHMAI